MHVDAAAELEGIVPKMRVATEILALRIRIGHKWRYFRHPVRPHACPVQCGFSGASQHPTTTSRREYQDSSKVSTRMGDENLQSVTSMKNHSGLYSPTHVGISRLSTGNAALLPVRDNARRILGEMFLSEIQSAGARDITHHWESFVASLRQSRNYGRVESRTVYWDRSASEKFVERQSDSFRDTGWCYLLSVDLGTFLFFPALVESARKSDLPNCRITSPGEPILRGENLVEFAPPKVQLGIDGWGVIEEGEVRYR
jgi:hypothetical protein